MRSSPALLLGLVAVPVRDAGAAHRLNAKPSPLTRAPLTTAVYHNTQQQIKDLVDICGNMGLEFDIQDANAVSLVSDGTAEGA